MTLTPYQAPRGQGLRCSGLFLLVLDNNDFTFVPYKKLYSKPTRRGGEKLPLRAQLLSELLEGHPFHTLNRLDSFVDATVGKRLTYKSLTAAVSK